MEEKDKKTEMHSTHFDTIEELVKTCKGWIIDEENLDDGYSSYCRWFEWGSMVDLINLIDKQQKEIEEKEELLKKHDVYEEINLIDEYERVTKKLNEVKNAILNDRLEEEDFDDCDPFSLLDSYLEIIDRK